jgi:glycosyltransferase involved in cell wall biosynthesis
MREGLSIALLEAMRVGKSIVTTSIGSNRTVVEDDRSALLVPPGSPETLRDAILYLLRNPEYANSLGNAARATFESKFTEEAMLERTRSLYAALLSGRDAVPAGSTPVIGPS